MVAVGCWNRYVPCKGVGEVGVLDDDGLNVKEWGRGPGPYKISLKRVEWQKRVGRQKF